ncbi:hypothetical protein [Martelella endophytica]|uniref:Lipoprotein n=1 Tax=Martelella endophytica TaxID=1486262 RepID=A0A0D5LUP8_MAREN|nr:hypothetical protein [Martelella endophytica]AJY47083.1 hypothetical protein TM49_17665 [Martelella endophytica]
MRLVLAFALTASLAGLSACANGCGNPDVCNTGTAAYEQLTPDQISSMTTELNALAKTPDP